MAPLRNAAAPFLICCMVQHKSKQTIKAFWRKKKDEEGARRKRKGEEGRGRATNTRDGRRRKNKKEDEE